jgi:hypothetical protein
MFILHNSVNAEKLSVHILVLNSTHSEHSQFYFNCGLLGITYHRKQRSAVYLSTYVSIYLSSVYPSIYLER